MTFIELYNRSAEAVELLNDYKNGDLNTLLTEYKNGTLTSPPDEGPAEPGPGSQIPDEQQQRLDTILERADRAVSGVEFPARRIGPNPIGEYHRAGGWGIHFTTNRALHLGRTTVDAETAGKFTATLAEYDGKSQFEPVQQREISVTAGPQRVELDFTIPESGEYILVREGQHPLKRGQWAGWGPASRDGLILKGGSKAGDYTKPNDYWYYFFNTSVAVDAESHLPEPTPLL